MLGAKNMTLGLLLCVLGVALLVGAHYAGLEGWGSKIAYAVIVVGGLLFVAGLLHSIIHHFAAPKGVHQDDAAVSAMALIRCMVAISIADDHLDNEEIRTITKIYTQLTGSDMEEDVVREAAEDMQREGIGISEELAHIKNIIDKGLKGKIVKASLFILAADGVVDQKEEEILEEIRTSLGIPKGKFNAVKEKFLASRGLS